MRIETMRDAVAAHVLPDVAKLLTLLDRNAASPTYGCFDRAYWHYRLIDFPCGMAQEFVLPLALAWSMPDLPANPYYRNDAIFDWVVAGIRFAARSAHADGSCDDYYPYERAAGAAAFSLFAILEALDRLDLGPDSEIDDFLLRRARWLAHHRESGRLANHEALIVACLERMRLRFPEGGFEAAVRDRLARLLAWQDEEGWFDEYGGADLGYLSLTIGLVADLDRRRPDFGLRPAVAKAIDFFAHFVHPDGSVGGEISSRSTQNFFAFGFEIAGEWHQAALAVNDRALRPMLEGRTPCHADDHIIGHHLWGWLLTLDHYRARDAVERPPIDGRAFFPHAGLLVERTDGMMLVAALAKGGVYKFFGAAGAVPMSDTGITFRMTERGRVAVTHLAGSRFDAGPDRIVCDGAMAWAKSARLTPARNVVLRLVMLGLGRFFPDLVRRLLQALLVTGAKPAPFRFSRVFERDAAGWTVTDTITADHGWSGIAFAGIGGYQTSITTIMARVFEPAQLVPFEDLTTNIAGLGADRPLVVKRRLGRDGGERCAS